uniref:Ubiquitin-like domain-containing protein n=1 Tax=Ascaris lumbricoides TaxID=6252 RepID=A0A9J2PRB8_ASCLU
MTVWGGGYSRFAVQNAPSKYLKKDRADLFFEILRRKTHIFCDAKETANVLELKRIVEGILKVPVKDQILKKQMEDSSWVLLDDRKTLAESGFSQANAKAQAPASIGLIVTTEEDELVIDPLSVPPPVPDAMRQETPSSGDQ